MPSISVPGAIIGSSLVGAGVSAYGASQAAGAQKDAANAANQTQLAMYNNTQALEDPYVQTGYQANNALNYLLGLPTQATGPGAAAAGAGGVGGGGTGALTTDQANALLQARPDVMQAYQQAVKTADPNSPAFAAAGLSSPQAYANHWYNQMGGSSSYQVPGSTAAGAAPTSANALQAAGLGAGSLLKPFTAADLPNDPGYQFQLSQGLNAIQNQSSVTGAGGNTLKALNDYAQGAASTEYQQAYNNYTGRQNTLFNMLSQLSGSGQNAASGLAAAGSNVANNISNNQIGAGNASAAGTVGVTNALTGGANNAMQNYLLYNLSNSGPGSVEGLY